MSLAAGVAELGELLRQTDPARWPGVDALEGATMAADSELARQLREAITASGLTVYALSKASGVDTAVLYRFLAGEKDLTLDTASRVAAVLNLTFTAKGKAKRKASVPPATVEGATFTFTLPPAELEAVNATLEGKSPEIPEGMTRQQWINRHRDDPVAAAAVNYAFVTLQAERAKASNRKR
jgi:transcriptional regulator with XRE-family HTH domain